MFLAVILLKVFRNVTPWGTCIFSINSTNGLLLATKIPLPVDCKIKKWFELPLAVRPGNNLKDNINWLTKAWVINRKGINELLGKIYALLCFKLFNINKTIKVRSPSTNLIASAEGAVKEKDELWTVPLQCESIYVLVIRFYRWYKNCNQLPKLP